MNEKTTETVHAFAHTLTHTFTEWLWKSLKYLIVCSKALHFFLPKHMKDDDAIVYLWSISSHDPFLTFCHNYSFICDDTLFQSRKTYTLFNNVFRCACQTLDGWRMCRNSVSDIWLNKRWTRWTRWTRTNERKTTEHGRSSLINVHIFITIDEHK